MPFAIAAAVIGGAATIGGAAIQSSAVGKAGQQSAFNRLLATQQAQQTFNTSTDEVQKAVQQGQGYINPYYAAGTPAIGQEGALLGLQGQDAANAAMATFQNSPSYAWQLGQGLRAIDAGAAAGVRQPGVRSGATIKAEEAYGQNLANTSFGDYYNRLNSLAGMGQNAAGSLANIGQTGAGQLVNIGSALNNAIAGQATNATNAQTGAANAQSSIFGNTASSLGGQVNTLFSDPAFQSTVRGFFGGNQAPGTAGGFNNGLDLISPTTGGVTLPPIPPVGATPSPVF